MSELNLKLENFNGPLDLLLTLIKENKMDINAIDIVLLATQYLDFIHSHNNFMINDASEYLAMASALIWIKSKSMVNSIIKLSINEQKDLDEKKRKIINQILLYKKYCDTLKMWNDLTQKRQKLYSQDSTTNKSGIQNISKVTSMPNKMNPNVLQKAMLNAYEKWKLNIFNNYNKIIVQEVSAEQVEKEIKKIFDEVKTKKIKQMSLSEFLNLIDQHLLTDQFFTTCFVSLLDFAKNQIIELKQKAFDSEIYINIM